MDEGSDFMSGYGRAYMSRRRLDLGMSVSTYAGSMSSQRLATCSGEMTCTAVNALYAASSSLYRVNDLS